MLGQVLAQAQQGDPDLIRPFFSFDFDDILSLVVATTALVALFVTKRSRSDTHTDTKAHEVSEVVDDSVLGQFKELFDRISNLETELATTKVDLARALAEIEKMRKLEEYLQAKLHEKDQEVRKLEAGRAKRDADIKRLRSELEAARKRIKHLEEVCHRAGLNGEDEEWLEK